MAWRCSGGSNTELIANLVQSGLIHSTRVAEAMKQVDRVHYCPNPISAYHDSPQPIGFGATISAPHMHAHACENLLPFLKPGQKVLDVGSGSGYTMAIFHHLVSPQGQVVGIDHIQQLVDQGKNNLIKDGLTNATQQKQIVSILGDGRKGYQQYAPYDAIHVGAAAPSVPEILVQQLNQPGRMFIPVDSSSYGWGQDIWQIDKDQHGNVERTKLYSVNYVPLTDADKQWNGN